MKIEFLATGDGQNCGIATYTHSLQRSLDIPSSRTPLKLRSLDISHYFQQAIRAARTDADVIHVQHEYGIYGPKSIASWIVFPILWVIATARRRPIVLTIHTAWNDTTIDPPLYPLKQIYVKLNNYMLVAVADQIIFLAEDTREAFGRSVSLTDRPVDVFPHGVQTDIRPMEQGKAKRQFGITPDEPLVVEPGYVRPQKGYDRFLEVASLVDEATFLVGGGPQGDEYAEYFEELRDRCDEQGVAVTGVLDEGEFHALFNAMDVAILPYDTVTQSGIVNWCLAYEVPFVATELERFRSLEEEYGFPRTFPSEDPKAGVSAVRELLDDPSAVIESMQRYRDRNSMDSIAERHQEVYQRLSTSA